MIDPQLEEAIGALRDGEPLAPGDELGTRARVLTSLAQRRQWRRVWTTAAMVVAFCVVGTTSWAWVTGWLPARLGGSSVRPPGQRELASGPRRGGAQPAPPAPAPEALAGPAPEALAGPAPEGLERPALEALERPALEALAGPAPEGLERPAPPQPASPAATSRRAAPVAVASPPSPRRGAGAERPPPSAAPSTAPAPSAPAPSAPTPDAELVAFRLAHDAHFGGGEPEAVLALWNGYLARFATGRLAPEARWNRAVLLVRLGRAAEARAALAPFAAATQGDYRQREAEALLQTLRSDP